MDKRISRAAFGILGMAAALALLVSALLAGSSQAARGVITVPDGVFAGTTVATVNPGGNVYVRTQCFQNGSLVFASYSPVDAANHAVIGLGPSQSWTTGSATCTADEGNFSNTGRWRSLASTTFNVSG